LAWRERPVLREVEWDSYQLHVIFVSDSAGMRYAQLNPRNVIAIKEGEIGAGHVDQIDCGLFEPGTGTRIHHCVVAIR